jgi:glycosyltransferase involved in cell wall biosynthesis
MNLPVEPQLMLVATSLISRLTFAHRLAKAYNLALVPYFLDNWITGTNIRYGGISLHKTAKCMLRNAGGWMVISESLKKHVEQFFGIRAPNYLVIHSPSVLVAAAPVNNVIGNPFYVIYAGSLYDMHYDALLLTAKALQQIRAMGVPAFLNVFCTQGQWDNRKNDLETLGVLYGGFLPPDRLGNEMQKASLLLVTASFQKSQKHYSTCSLQTKVTEYMGAGVPVLSVGPEYGECNRFFKKHNCGFVLEKNDCNKAIELLHYIMNSAEERNKMAAKALQLAETKYSKINVQKNLYGFLEKNVTLKSIYYSI